MQLNITSIWMGYPITNILFMYWLEDIGNE